jgi:hypothetical protein
VTAQAAKLGLDTIPNFVAGFKGSHSGKGFPDFDGKKAGMQVQSPHGSW